MTPTKSYIYMGNAATNVVLRRWEARVVVKPGEVVDSEIKLSGNFIVFDDTILDKYDAQIESQQAHIDSTTETYDIQRNELLKKHKDELKAFDAKRDSELEVLNGRLEVFLDKKATIAENINKATNIIDKQVAMLEEKKAQLELVVGDAPKAPKIEEPEVVEVTIPQLKARLDELGVVYPQHGLKKADYEALVAKAEAELEEKKAAEAEAAKDGSDDTTSDPANADGTQISPEFQAFITMLNDKTLDELNELMNDVDGVVSTLSDEEKEWGRQYLKDLHYAETQKLETNEEKAPF